MLRGGRWIFGLFVIGIVPSTASAAPESIGAERCGACHVKEYQDWKASPHARALARLSDLQQKDPVCRSCHTMVPTSKDPALTGVQCESCHGPGSMYAPQYVMKDEVLAKLLGLKDITEKTCAPCHAGTAPNIRPFDFAAWVKEVDHKSDDEAATSAAPTLPKPTQLSQARRASKESDQ